MIVWAAVEPDEYELIYAVADSAQQLANLLGIKKGTIYRNMMFARQGKAKPRYLRIEIPDDENEQDLILAAVDHAVDMNCSFIPQDELIAVQAIENIRNKRKKDKSNGKQQ